MLALCADAGLVRVGVIAVDGTKVAANAAPQATRDYEQIAREILAEADAVDAEEDEQFGDARGDELPPELATAQGRRGWLREAKRRLDDKRAEEARPIPRDRPDRLTRGQAPPRGRAPGRVPGQRRLRGLPGARASTRTARRFGRPPKPFEPPPAPAGKINLSDLDSRNVKTSRGWVQGYNAQAVATEDQIVIAAEVTVASPDFGHLEPMIRAARDELRRAGIEQPPDVVLADAGYWHQVQMERLLGDGLTVLIPPDAKKRAGARPGWDGGLYAFMRRVLDTDAGGELYAKRQTMIEPIFADTKFNRRIDRFLRRGRSAARSEWRLTNAAHNLLKLWRHTTAPAAA